MDVGPVELIVLMPAVATDVEHQQGDGRRDVYAEC
jgi:hypothetical protein